MEKLNIKLNIDKLENFNLSETVNIDQMKLTMEKVKQSIYQKSKNNPEIGFLLKRL